MQLSYNDERGWASIEFALITPAVVFLAFVMGAVVAVAGDRARLIASAHAAALAAMRGEPQAAVAAAAGAGLPPLQLRDVTITPEHTGGIAVVKVCVIAHRSLPRPLAAMSLTWRECASAPSEP